MSKIPLIIKREYFSRVRKKSFIVMSILGPLLIAGLMIMVIWMGMAENENQKLIVVDDLKPAFAPLKTKSNINIRFDYSDMELSEAKKLLYNSDYTGILYIPHNILHANTAQLFFLKQPSVMVQRSIENKVESIVEVLKLKKYKIKKEDFYNVKTNFRLNPILYKESGKEEVINKENAYVGFAFGFFIYMFIFLYGVQVMRGVIEEKTSRIVEVIISSVKPFELMMGKIIGIAMVGITQLLIWIALTVGIVTIGQSVFFASNYDAADIVETMQMTSEMKKQVETETSFSTKELIDKNNLIFRINWPLMIGMFMFYFLGGYLLYSALFAAIGSAVDSETDTQQFMLPVSMPLVLAYIMSVFIIENPEGPAAFWFSIIPFTSPVVMMVRIAMGINEGAIWEVVLSMVLLIGTFIFVVWLAGRIYRTGILMYGKKVSYKELWKWLFYKS
ncbi:MAG TPA: ABC transporter permease [Flavobacteriales bacterium]|nr:ABC transporter permease [Flavobacteriales bacterium]HIN38734.1 ABC transporter permease [Flavobacteriales bacterium]